jgi:hypothetical protein
MLLIANLQSNVNFYNNILTDYQALFLIIRPDNRHFGGATRIVDLPQVALSLDRYEVGRSIRSLD